MLGAHFVRPSSIAGASAPREGVDLIAFNALLATEPSMWFHLGGFMGTLQEWLDAGGGSKALTFVLVDVALLACYAWVAWLSVRCILRTTDGAMTSNSASQSETACSLV